MLRNLADSPPSPFAAGDDLPAEGFIAADSQVKNVSIGTYTEIAKANVLENVELDDYSYTSPYCIIQNTSIGKFVNIAAMVRIGPVAHPMQRASLHHFTYRRRQYGLDQQDDAGIFDQRQKNRSFIGHDVWLGHGVTVMAGVRIGIGAVIGSGAVVTADVPDFAVAVGVPARIIKTRFEPKLANALLASAWWNWTHQELKDRMSLFVANAEDFADKWVPGWRSDQVDAPSTADRFSVKG